MQQARGSGWGAWWPAAGVGRLWPCSRALRLLLAHFGLRFLSLSPCCVGQVEALQALQALGCKLDVRADDDKGPWEMASGDAVR